MSFQSILSTEIDLLEDSLLEESDEQEEFKKGVLLVCVLAVYVRERIEWESTFNNWLKRDQKLF